jgi:sulfate adenylyltransferase subunit 1
LWNQSGKIHFFDKFDEAAVSSSITIELENDINVTRRYDSKIIELPRVKRTLIQRFAGWIAKN